MTKKELCLIVDIDGTIYTASGNPGKDYLSAGVEAENAQLASKLGCSTEAVAQAFANASHAGGTRTTTVLGAFQQSLSWWNEIRTRCYHPHDYLQPNPTLLAAFQAVLRAGYRIVFATNNPSAVGLAVLDACGLGSLLAQGVSVEGPDTLSVSKAAASLYFRAVANRVGVDPGNCISIGDRYDVDCKLAAQIGMHPLWVQSETDLLEALDLLTTAGIPTTLDAIVHSSLPVTMDRVSIVAIMGQAGSGKTTLAPALADRLRRQGIDASVLSLDAYFKLSSAQRRQWIDGAVGDEVETAYRKDQINWWDFKALETDLMQLRATGVLHRKGVYNRADGGELTGSISLEFARERGVVIVEGVALAHAQLPQLFDATIMVRAHRRTREHDLLVRDIARRPDPEEARQRFELTEAFENRYFNQIAPCDRRLIITRVGSLHFLG